MYEYIKGEIAELTPTSAVIEANSVGYLLHISLNTYSALEGQKTGKLYIEEVIREDAFTLFGFSDLSERALFRQLVSVSGVGVILSSFSVQELQQVIASGDVNAIKKVKGIGLKTAQRLIIDLKDKVKPEGGSGVLPLVSARNEVRDEAVQALSILGYPQPEAAKLVDAVLSQQPDMPLDKLIKESLRQNGKK